LGKRSILIKQLEQKAASFLMAIAIGIEGFDFVDDSVVFLLLEKEDNLDD
jgi:hypothetical protein